MNPTESVVVTHTVHRLSVLLGLPFDDAVRRYERLVPVADMARFAQLPTWDAALELADSSAPLGFLRYWRLDVTALLAQAGPGWKCVEYLMGNHTIAEQMYRHDPTALLHAPLRTMIHADRDGATFFTIDQPSTLFSNFDNADIAATGRHLDALVVGLLDAMDAPVPAELRLVGAAS